MDKFDGNLVKSDNPSIVYKAHLVKSPGRSDGRMTGFIVEKDDGVRKHVIVFPNKDSQADGLLSGVMIRQGSSNREYVRGMMGAQALPYDSKVEYLETTGAQRVITDIVVPSTNTEIKVYTRLKDTSGASASRVIVSSGASGQSAALQFYANAGRWFIGTTSVIKSNSVFQSVTAIRKGSDNTNSIEISGGNANNGTDNGRDAGGQYIVLSAFYSGNLPSNSQQNQIISIYFDNVFVARMIPVRVGSVGYWYDEINHKMWRSDTGTDYIAGPDVI